MAWRNNTSASGMRFWDARNEANVI